MSNRQEVAMIVALIGLNQEIIDNGVYVVPVLMSLLATLITPIVYRNWFYKGEFYSYDASGILLETGDNVSS